MGLSPVGHGTSGTPVPTFINYVGVKPVGVDVSIDPFEATLKDGQKNKSLMNGDWWLFAKIVEDSKKGRTIISRCGCDLLAQAHKKFVYPSVCYRRQDEHYSQLRRESARQGVARGLCC